MGIVAAVVLAGAVAGAGLAGAGTSAYLVHNLVADLAGVADHTDPNLVNGWGVALNPFGPAWVADNGTGVATVYDGLGNPALVPDGTGKLVPLVVQIPGGAPTGIVFNGSNDFVVSRGGLSGPARFLFASEAGIISAWAPAVDPTHAIVVVDNSLGGTVYKGLALAGDGTRLLLYATDFHNRRIDVFDKTFAPVTTAGGFVDNNVSDTFGPFGIQSVGGSIYVTYARRDKAGHDDVPGRGEGILNVFSASGVLVARLAKGGPLNAPWGMALAPANFGTFSNHLIVGNFGDGTINTFDLSRGRFDGQLARPDGTPIVIPGLWGLAFGNGVSNQPTNVLFFAAGPDDEQHGLYGRIDLLP
ncbi:MAG TPA: TIGR03118 family protein [Acidimicrobiales bacterium]|nr:TIGR03118 family protein [Acidimicrobiales bacterium]